MSCIYDYCMYDSSILSTMCSRVISFFFFFFNDTATTEIYTLSLHDALPILQMSFGFGAVILIEASLSFLGLGPQDRKSTRLNSSHSQISYAVFCLKKKKKKYTVFD